ncbi:glycoside hydrolase family 97 protein [Ginsengibacter hankyongi]|uniref:Glycoside hydrolase family 97 protein n=1 Tax=Ginsengibacter hankyongi TaxID=2607284 RepID=A0A5J5IE35_9BACT|nr:glycoside hydrolase family 97 protein [Ginsengibacter hankyongi]KAA9037291.1 glycoside hydrolase family 97 protein [Ginsengibacter hankyongi]
MFSKKAITVLFSVFLFTGVSGQNITAELQKLKMVFTLNKGGVPVYSVSYDQKPIIQQSTLGFILANNDNFYSNFEILGSEKKSIDETWKPVWGEVNEIRNHYGQVTVHLKQVGTNRLLDIVFRVFADGVGFRYEFPKQPAVKYFIVTDELTQFNLTGDHKAFWIPGDYETNEYPYATSKLSEIDNEELVEKSTAIAVRVAPDRYAVQTPLMLKTDDGLYINIHEAALVNYSAMQLHVNDSTYQLSARLVPDALGNKAYLHASFHTPWRTIIVSNKAEDILASKMILNLNDPSAIKNTSWIKPMKFVGVWWEMQTGKGTWSYSDYPDSADAHGKPIPNGRHSANTANVKRYIDFASKNGIKGLLVEGWNTGWEDWFGNWKENVFDFVTPYPDFDVKEISNYAKAKGVEMIMHNETSAFATNYERQMDTAFRFMNQFGHKAVKTGYVGKIIPRGEHHDGQWMVNHYLRSIEKAASYHVMIDIHEPVRPTGLQRTWPNFLACEAARGNEYNAFSDGNAPEHETILPFTRLMGGPMDYTPGIFKLRNYTADKTRRVHTTLAKQLALYVTLYSPLQMAADLPENYEAHMDAFQFIKDVPVDWDDTKILAAEPGDYIAIARKGKESNNWFLGAITDENARQLTADLSFLDKNRQYTATNYADAADADWKTNPEAYTIKKMVVNSTTHLLLKLAPGGGAAVSIVPR